MSIAEKLQTIADNEQKVYEAGKQAEHSDFWDTFQDNGNRTNYNNVFNSYWNEENFKPKYDIKIVGSATYVLNNLKVSDVEKALDACGVKLDTSGMTSANQVFYGSAIKVLPTLDFSNVTSIYYTFTNMHGLVTIRKIILPKTAVGFGDNPFNNCGSLQNVEFVGTIYKRFTINHSNYLSHDTLMNIINVLADYSGTSTTYTLTIGSTNLAKLTEEEKAIATQKGWTLA